MRTRNRADDNINEKWKIHIAEVGIVMSEKTIDTGTAVGKTAMIQVLSAIAIIVCTLFFGVPGSDILGMMFAGILYVIGFL